MAKSEANSNELKILHDSSIGPGRRPGPMEKSCAYFELARLSLVCGHGFSISTRNFLSTVAQYYTYFRTGDVHPYSSITAATGTSIVLDSLQTFMYVIVAGLTMRMKCSIWRLPICFNRGPCLILFDFCP